MSKSRLKFLIWLIWFYHWCEKSLETLPSKKTGSKSSHIFFEPISTTAILTSLIISAASFGAQLIVSKLLAKKQKPQVRGKLTGDITLTDSIFGAPIPRIYGARPASDSAGGVEVGGNVIWMSDIRVVTTTVPGSSGGGGKGAPKSASTQQKDYYVDISIAAGQGPLRLLRLKLNEDIVFNNISASGITGVYDPDYGAEDPQDNFLLPDPYESDPHPQARYNGVAETDTEGIITTIVAGGAEMAWYPGTETQPVDSVMQAALGAGLTPAFRGTGYLRLRNLNFSKYGSIPQVRMVVENMTTGTVAEICLAEALLAGLSAADLDLTAAADKNIRGYFIAGNDAPSKTFQDMAAIHHLAFVETNSDGKIVCKNLSDRTSKATVRRADLAAYVADESEEPPVDDVTSVLPDPSEKEVRTLELQYNNPLAPSDYSTDRATFTNPFTPSLRTETSQINVTLTPDEALSIVKRELQTNILKNIPHAISVPHKYCYLDACDCLDLEIDSELKRVRIENLNGSAPGIFEMSVTSEDIFQLADESITDVFADPPIVTVASNSVATLMDLPALADFEGLTTGVYVAACAKDSSSGSWAAATVYRYKGADYEPMTMLTKQALIGIAAAALPDAPSGYAPGAVDTAHSLIVDFFGTSMPTTLTADQIDDGAGRIVAGNEIIAVRTWTRDNSYPNRWTGTNLTRRLISTDAASAAHVAGERVVFLDEAVKFVALDESERGIEREWKFVTAGQLIDDAPAITFTWEGANKETNKPAIGQNSAATNTSVEIGVTNYTDFARFRKIEYSSSSSMTSITTGYQNASDFPNHQLPGYFYSTRSTGLTSAQTRYVRVSHSSNNVQYSPVSDVLSFTFPNSGGSGGSPPGGGGPIGCFTEDFLVSLAGGRQIRFGELAARRAAYIDAEIKGFDAVGNIRADYIEEIFIHTVFDYLEVTFETGAKFEVTREHPFWDEYFNFTAVGNLKVNEKVRVFDREWNLRGIISVVPVHAPGGIEVYNLRTRIFHHYLIADPAMPDQEYAVHNSKQVPIPD